MGRQTDAHCGQTCRNRVRNAVGLGQNHRQRPRPERLGQLVRRVGQIGCQAENLLEIGDVDNQRIVLRAALGRENLGDRLGVERVGRQSVDRLGRHADHLACAQQVGGLGQRLGVGTGIE